MTTCAERERQLIEVIETIKRDYMRQIEPYIKELANLRALQPPRMVINRDGEVFHLHCPYPDGS